MKKLVMMLMILFGVFSLQSQEYVKEIQRNNIIYYKIDSIGNKCFISEDQYLENKVNTFDQSIITDSLKNSSNILYSNITNNFDDEILFETQTLLNINKKLKNTRITKGIGISAYFAGGIMCYYGGLKQKEDLIYVGAGVNLIGLVMWICSPTKHLAYQAHLSGKRIIHLRTIKHKYDVSIFQPKDNLGLGLCLKF